MLQRVEIVIRQMDRPRDGRHVDQRHHRDQDRVQRNADQRNDRQAGGRTVNPDGQHQRRQSHIPEAEPGNQQAQQTGQAGQADQGIRALAIEGRIHDRDPTQSHFAARQSRRLGRFPNQLHRGFQVVRGLVGQHDGRARLAARGADHHAPQSLDGQCGVQFHGRSRQ